RTNLRQCLSTMRKHLGAALVTDGDEVMLDAAIDLDAGRFEQLIGEGSIPALEDAAAVYAGDLLDGFALKEEAFEDWIRPVRERYRGLMIDVLLKLVEHYETVKDAAALTQAAARLLALDPLNERVHRMFMRTYAAQGRYGAALKQFENCRELLKRELGVEPESATVDLNRELRRRRSSQADADASEPAPIDDLDEGPPLPVEPSIAVLPFTNMNTADEDDFFADGISEDIITALSKISTILVIARNSSFIYKGSAVDVKQVGREQGVRYVLEGSVRRAGTRARVTAQLVDATTGHHMWAERFDRDLDDMFAIQDEITREIVVALDVQLREGEQARVWSRGTNNVEAWECVRLGMDAINQITPESRIEGRKLIARALELDPNYPMAWVSMGWIYFHEADFNLGPGSKDARDVALRSAEECVPKALELDPSYPDAFALLGLCHLSHKAYDDAIAAMERAVALAPNHAENLAIAGAVLNKSGQPERSFELINRAMRLCPIYPSWYLYVLATACRLLHRSDTAVSVFEQGIKRNPDNLSMHVGLASTLGELSREQEARLSVTEILRLDPDFSISGYARQLSYRDPAELARFEDGLRKAGLPA
ncbi:MAG: BTAD domain-containing putative transcriptional regulator, partial [Hyphomicrobiaceae bacterium]